MAIVTQSWTGGQHSPCVTLLCSQRPCREAGTRSLSRGRTVRLGRLRVVHTTGVCLSCGCNLGLSLSEVLDFCNKQAVADAGCCGLKFMSFSVFCIHQLPPSETQRGPAIGGQCSLHEGQKGQQGTPRGAHDSPEPTQPRGWLNGPFYGTLEGSGRLRNRPKVTHLIRARAGFHTSCLM